MLGLLAHPSLPPQMDPVQKAVLSHTFGGPLLKTKRPIISCNVCQIRFNSQVRSPATLPPHEWSMGSQGVLGEDRGWELWVRGRDSGDIRGRAGHRIAQEGQGILEGT